MSGLVLNVQANDAGLVKIDKVLTRLELLLKEPTSVNLTGLNAQVERLEKDAVTTTGAVSRLEKELRDLAAAGGSAAKGAVAADAAIDKAGVSATAAKKSVNLLTASYSTLAKKMVVSDAALIKHTTAMRVQQEKALDLQKSIMGLTAAQRATMSAYQGQTAVTAAMNKEFALQSELQGLMLVQKNTNIKLLKAETLALAKQALLQKAITQERYNDIAGIKKQTSAINQQTVATRGATTAAHNLNGAMRGAAGASGTLWLSYGAILPLLATFAAVSGTIKGHKEALNFEYAVGYMEALGKATGDTSANLENLRHGLVGIKGVAHGPNDLAVSLKALMKAGFTAAESMSELQTLSRLATVAEEDLATTTAAVISQFRAWSVESVGASRGVNTMSEAANVLAAAALTTTLDVGELAKMMKYTPVLASQSAASFTELTAALGTMSNMGVRGTTAATSLRTAMLQLQSPTSKTRGLLKDLGIEVDLFTEEGKLRSMSGAFDALATSLQGVTDKKRLELLKSMFSIRAGSAGAIMLGQFNKAIQEGTFSFKAQVEMLEKVKREGRFIDDMYQDLSKTTQVLWEETKAAWSREAIASFDAAPIQDFVRGLKDFADSGAMSSLVGGLTEILSLMGGIADRMLVKPATGIANFFGMVGDDLTNLQVKMFGATEGFLAAQDAVGLYKKEQSGTIEYSYAEAAAIRNLVYVYGSLAVAAKAQPFDERISLVRQTVARLEQDESALLAKRSQSGLSSESLKGVNAQLKNLEKARAELSSLIGEKARLVADPKAWQAEQDRLKSAEERTRVEAEGVADAIKLAQDRRKIEMVFAETDRANLLSDSNFKIQLLEKDKGAQLKSLSDYAIEKKVINDQILQDDLALLEKQHALAKELHEEAVLYAETDTAKPGADKASLAAEVKERDLANKIEQKKLEQQRSDELFAKEVANRTLETQRRYAETSVAIEKERIDAAHSLSVTSLSDQEKLLEERHAAGLISEQGYINKKRELARSAFEIDKESLQADLGVWQKELEAATALPESDENRDKVRLLKEDIKRLKEDLVAVGVESKVFEDFITLGDLARARDFKNEILDIQKAHARLMDDKEFELSIRTLGSTDQALESDKRGLELEHQDKIAALIEQEGASEAVFRKVEKINALYAEMEVSLIDSYARQQQANMNFWEGMTAGANEYVDSTENVFESLASAVTQMFGTMEDSLVEFARTGKLDFSSLADSIISDMMRIAIQQSITQPLAGAASQFLGTLLGGKTYAMGMQPSAGMGPALANGGAFDHNGRIEAFASGGVVNSPTVFPFANGTGLMGEAGPEAIMPLTRINGKLGVESSGGGATNVVVNNYGDAQNVSVDQQQNKQGGTDIIVTLEKELASRMQSRGGRLSKAMESVYGLRRAGGR